LSISKVRHQGSIGQHGNRSQTAEFWYRQNRAGSGSKSGPRSDSPIATIVSLDRQRFRRRPVALDDLPARQITPNNVIPTLGDRQEVVRFRVAAKVDRSQVEHSDRIERVAVAANRRLVLDRKGFAQTQEFADAPGLGGVRLELHVRFSARVVQHIDRLAAIGEYRREAESQSHS
jgi:hypothetical protein